MWGNEPSHSQVNSHFGSWNPDGFSNIQRAIARVKPIGLRSSLYHWKYFKTYMFEMALHDPFAHLNHKLWPKERLGIKLALWLPTTKNQELSQFPCVQVACDIPLESPQQGLQLFLSLHLNWRVCTKNYGPPKLRESELWEFWDSHLRISGQNDIWVLVPWPSTKYTIRGKVMASLKSGSWWVL